MLLRSYPSVFVSVGGLAVRPSFFRSLSFSNNARYYSSTLSSSLQLIGRRFATSAQSVPPPPPLQSLSAALSNSCVARYDGKPLICYGCGAAFQSDFENRAGYIDRSVLQRYLTALDDARSMGSLSPLKAASEGLEKMDLYMADRLKAMEEGDNETRERRLTRGQRQEQEYLREDPGREVMRIKEVSMNESTESKESAKYVLMDQSDPQKQAKKDDQAINGVTIIDSTVEDKKASKADAAKTESLIAAFNKGEIDEFTLMGQLSQNGQKRAFLTKQDIKDIKKMEKFQRHFRVNPSAAELANTVDDPHKKDTMLTLSKQLHCARCHSLVHNGYAHGHLDSIRAEDFRLFLKERFTNPRSPRSVLIWLIDIADFEGSIIHDMHTLVGAHNPIILAINKMDLMPNTMNESKLRHWLKTECQRRGIDYASMILLSAKHGQGMNQLVKEALDLAKSNRRAGLRDIYVVGTTNVGKSTLINQLINKGFIRGGSLTDPVTIHPEKNVAIADPSTSATDGNNENKSSDSEAIHLPVNSTASPMPGTTLGMVKFHILPRTSGLHLYDTPGIIQRSHFSQHLTIDELKVAMPRTTRITPRSYRINAGQSVLIGGLVRIDQMAGAPFYYTFFLHNEVTVHITSIEKLEGEEDPAVLYDQRFVDGDKKRKLQKLADNPPSLSDEQRKANYRAFFHKNIGKIVSPPFTSDRFDALALVDGVRIRFTTEGKGWDVASDDIVLPGLGWISLTGCGPLSVRVQCAAGVMAHRREPIMPNEARRSTKKWTGVHRILG